MLRLTPFRHEFQDTTRTLILDGLAEHWGSIDNSLNTDLVDIAAAYADDVFLVALEGDDLVGTGAMRVRHPQGELVRMSVRRDARRRGIATLLTDALVREAKARGLRELVLETQASWRGTRAFYEHYGFAFTHIAEGAFGPDAWYRLDLDHVPVGG